MSITNEFKNCLYWYQTKLKNRVCDICKNYFTEEDILDDNINTIFSVEQNLNWKRFLKDDSRGRLTVWLHLEHKECGDVDSEPERDNYESSDADTDEDTEE